MARRRLLSPAFLLAVLVLATNDHLLKGSGLAPGWLTGKLSDLAGLLIAPLLLATLVGARGGAARTACDLAVALVFVAIKVDAASARTWSAIFGAAVVDPTDLVALPMIALGRVLWPAGSAPASIDHAERRQRRATVAVAVVALTVCAGTSAQRIYSGIPPQTWRQEGTVLLDVDDRDAEVALEIAFPHVPLACADLARDPRAALAPVAFDVERAGFAESDVPLDREAKDAVRPACGIVLVRATESRFFGIGAKSLPPTYVVWRRDRVASQGGHVKLVVVGDQLALRPEGEAAVFVATAIPTTLPALATKGP